MSTRPMEDMKPWCDYRVAIVHGIGDKRIETGEDFDARALGSLWDMRPTSLPKHRGMAFLPSLYHDYDAREHAAQRERGQFVAIVGDVDKGQHPLELIESAVKKIAGGAAYLIFSTPHSCPANLRWRIIIPLDRPIAFPEWRDAQEALCEVMLGLGVEMDSVTERAGQIAFLPNVPSSHEGQALRDSKGPLYFQRAATSIDHPGLSLASQPISRAIADRTRRRAEDDALRAKMREEAQRRRSQIAPSDGEGVIETFNRTADLPTMLRGFDYKQSPRNPDDWRSPNQTSDSYATRIMGNSWVSLSGTDAALGIGAKHASGCFGDAYDLFVFYEHGGNKKAAWKAACDEQGRSRSNNVHYLPQAAPPDWMQEVPPYEDVPEWAEMAPDDEPDCGQPNESAQEWPEPVDLWARFEEPELPEHLLPPAIETFARRQAAIMGADPAGMAMAALAVCATAIPDCIELQVKRNDPTWREHACLWVALVGPPSRKKTPVFKAVMSPLRAIDNKLMRAFLEASEEYEALSKDDKKLSPKPKQRRLIISDATIEAAQEVMMDSPDGILSEQDELSGWFGSMDRYNTKGGGDRAFWLKAFNGGTYNLNRIGRGAKQISNLSISLLGGIQPEPMRKFASESVDDGLLQRMLPVILRPSTVGQDIAQDQAAHDYSQLVAGLYSLRQRGPWLIHFSDGARVVRDRLEREHLELAMALEVVSPKLSAHYGKYDGIFARLCLIWHCIENAYGETPDEISENTAHSVADFMQEFIRPSAVSFYAGVLGMSAGHEELVALASIIVAKGMSEVAARDVQSAGQALRHLTADQFRQIASKMEAFGWLEQGEPKPRSNTPRWLVNPRVHALFADRAEVEMKRRDAARDALRSSLKGGKL